MPKRSQWLKNVHLAKKSTPKKWLKDVREWFKNNTQEKFQFLNTDELRPRTVQKMVCFKTDTLYKVMKKCMYGCTAKGGKGLGNNKVRDMYTFDKRLNEALKDRLKEGLMKPDDSVW